MQKIGGLKFRNLTKTETNTATDEIMSNPYGIPDGIDSLIDIGANIGGTALKFANMGVSVIAYEPNRESFLKLRKNVIENELSDNILLFNLGIGNAGKRKLLKDKVRSGCSSFYKNNTSTMTNRSESIKVIDIDDIDFNWCDVMKIDCEGAEYEFLSKLPFKKIGQVSAEIHNIFGIKKQHKLVSILINNYKTVNIKMAHDMRSLIVIANDNKRTGHTKPKRF